jgi:hypothetical protein
MLHHTFNPFAEIEIEVAVEDYEVMSRRSEQIPELFFGKACGAHNSSHRVGIDRIMAGDCQDPGAIGHDNVFALAHDAEACSLQGLDGLTMRYAGNLAQARPRPRPLGRSPRP